MHDKAMFLTLTYSPEHLPDDAGLHHEDFQDFMKRYRKKYVPKNPYDKDEQKEEYEAFRLENAITYMMCGEYGEKPKRPDREKVVPVTGRKWRPHFHVAIFNHEFTDLQLYSYWESKGRDFRLYESPTLDKLWGKGSCKIGDLTFESAAYIARYNTKKLTGNRYKDKEGNIIDVAEEYRKINKETGEIFDVKKEYIQASRRPAIGKRWWDLYKEDTLKDYLHVRGVKMKPPKYYDRKLEELDEEIFNAIKEDRARKAVELQQPRKRLKTMEEIKERKLNKLKREDN
jgi:hypothetical protein